MSQTRARLAVSPPRCQSLFPFLLCSRFIFSVPILRIILFFCLFFFSFDSRQGSKWVYFQNVKLFLEHVILDLDLCKRVAARCFNAHRTLCNRKAFVWARPHLWTVFTSRSDLSQALICTVSPIPEESLKTRLESSYSLPSLTLSNSWVC